MVEPRHAHTAVTLPDGRIFIAGGEYTSYSTEFYDPVSKSFTLGPEMPRPLDSHFSVCLPDGRVLFNCGESIEYERATFVHDMTDCSVKPGKHLLKMRDHSSATLF